MPSVEKAGILKENMFVLLEWGETKFSRQVLTTCICVDKTKGHRQEMCRTQAFLETPKLI